MNSVLAREREDGRKMSAGWLKQCLHANGGCPLEQSPAFLLVVAGTTIVAVFLLYPTSDRSLWSAFPRFLGDLLVLCLGGVG